MVFLQQMQLLLMLRVISEIFFLNGLKLLLIYYITNFLQPVQTRLFPLFDNEGYRSQTVNYQMEFLTGLLPYQGLY